ncbi:MAG: putative lipid II flippase FtsW [Desulfobacterales bacterium]|nr:putative lipid II flippase FtsW [Desulfobacterales bacterium]
MNRKINEKETNVSVSYSYDFSLLLPVILLVGIGTVMVYSSSSEIALRDNHNTYYFVNKQGVFALLGMLGLIFTKNLSYNWLKLLVYPFLFLSFVLLSAVLFSHYGSNAGGATRWLKLGPLTFQPSEFAKFSLIIYLAYSISKKDKKLEDIFVGFIPHVIVLIIFAIFLLMQPDFGSVVIFGILSWIMMYIGGVKVKHLSLSLFLFVPIIGVICVIAPYRVLRWLAFLWPWEYSNDASYQIVHSFMAFGTGGIWGVGLGQGIQKLFYLPEPHTDFIFSVIGEEIGLVGILFIVSMYILITWRGLIISKNTDDKFGSFVAFGITIALALQVSINMGVTLGLLPPKGLSLPFLSYGGSSLLFNMACIGILMNIKNSGA